MGTNLQGYHLLWPDLPTFSQLQFTALNFSKKLGLKATQLLRERVAGFSIIQSTTNRMKPGEKKKKCARVCFSSKPQPALARRY